MSLAIRTKEMPVPVFDFAQSVARSDTADRERAGSGDEIDVEAV